MNALAPIASNPLMPTSMDGAMRLAEMMARGRLVPKHLQDQPGDCLMVIEQAMRWGMSPFAVAQCTSVIQGKLMFEGKLVSAALHGSGVLASRLAYEFSGEGPARQVTVTGQLQGDPAPKQITLTLREAKTSNGIWEKQPDQQLVYAGTRVWARRHAPEVMLGVYSPEEFDQPPPGGPTIEHQAPPPPPTPPAPATQGDAPHKRLTVSQWLDALELALKDADTDRVAVDRILSRDDVMKATGALTNGALDRLQRITREALARAAPVNAETPTLDEWVEEAISP